MNSPRPESSLLIQPFNRPLERLVSPIARRNATPPDQPLPPVPFEPGVVDVRPFTVLKRDLHGWTFPHNLHFVPLGTYAWHLPSPRSTTFFCVLMERGAFGRAPGGVVVKGVPRSIKTRSTSSTVFSTVAPTLGAASRRGAANAGATDFSGAGTSGEAAPPTPADDPAPDCSGGVASARRPSADLADLSTPGPVPPDSSQPACSSTDSLINSASDKPRTVAAAAQHSFCGSVTRTITWGFSLGKVLSPYHRCYHRCYHRRCLRGVHWYPRFVKLPCIRLVGARLPASPPVIRWAPQLARANCRRRKSGRAPRAERKLSCTSDD